ncbi:hypothetical protein F5888DRAFT_1802967 [Russula emetica]|nr:hypothetical protein F5888DRAFT_1802967 [Russula emetica]
MALARLFSANTSLRLTQTKTRDLNLPKPGSPSTASLLNLHVVHKLQICSTRAKNDASSLLRLPRTKMRTTAAEAVSLSSQGIDVEEVEAGTELMTETRTNETPSREWVPIIPSTPHSQQRPRPDSSLANRNRAREVKTTWLGDEVAPEQGGDGTDVQLHSHEREGEEGRD